MVSKFRERKKNFLVRLIFIQRPRMNCNGYDDASCTLRWEYPQEYVSLGDGAELLRLLRAHSSTLRQLNLKLEFRHRWKGSAR